MNFVNNFGQWWLSGPKYELSAKLHGASWYVNIETALNYQGRSVRGCKTLDDVVRVFRGREFWKPDGAASMADTVLPPDFLLANKGDDCDGWAMTHAQSVNIALGHLGWRAYCVTYLADPWWMSHHFAAAVAPDGMIWAIQPQPTEEQWRQYGDRIQTVFGPFRTMDDAINAIAAQYKASPVWWDKRGDRFEAL